MARKTHVTDVLQAWNRGDGEALEDLVNLVYTELYERCRRALSKERPNHTLAPTGLLNEVYLRLAALKRVSWTNRATFFAFSVRLIRQVLVEHARTLSALKRGGAASRIDLDLAHLADQPTQTIDVLALDEALELLEERDPRMVKIIELRFFAGMTEEECSEALELSRATVQRDWRFAKRWLASRLSGEADGSGTLDHD